MAADSPEGAQKKRQSPPPVEFMKPGEAQAPLPPRDQSPAAWVPRPEEYQPPTSWTPLPRAAPAASNLPKIAGSLLLIAGVVGMAGALYNAVMLPSPADYAKYLNETGLVTAAAFQVCGLISIWSQAISILGGVMAIQRMNWKLTLVCAIFSLATLGFFVEASVIGSVGLVLTIRARRYFVT